ncbi:hypothetical protein LCGC14_0535900 [marine sediment metagenome]|uniref:Mechanosensitive ion channel family protein n=1 Tax=marine sediment metagenome TaxID=412755 RepID=A0A0F9UFP5_9ZZZZ|nr:mechanosensitive ion channel family protein [Phycisphaerae bacterium]HDZ43042.1 mechanosensitive ion channel family protein [Phycisphaerae bacterium]
MTVTLLANLGGWFYRPWILDNEPWRWASLLGVIFGSMVLGKTLSFLLIRHADHLAARPGWQGLEATFRSIERPAIMLLVVLGAYLSRFFMDLSVPLGDEGTTLAHIWDQAVRLAASLGVGWLIYRLVDVVEHYLLRLADRTDTPLDNQLVPLIRKALRVFVVIIAALYVAKKGFQADIGTLLAGLGLGGLAFALAAKDTIANLFGSITIFADRPFHKDDRIRVHGHDGFIEEVGFRSTRIRTLTGNQVIIPNAVIANETIENVSRRTYIKRSLAVTVTYDTSPEKVRRAVAILKEMLAARADSFPEDRKGRVHFTDFNADSLNIGVTYWFTPPEWEPYLDFTHDFNMELLQRFNDEGIEFAFPTQTLYLKKDAGNTEPIDPSSQKG